MKAQSINEMPTKLMEMITRKLLGDENMIHDGKKSTR